MALRGLAALAALGLLLPGALVACDTATVTAQGVPAAVSISGTVGYSGTVSSAHQIVVILDRPGALSPFRYQVLSNPGPYLLEDVPAGTYTVWAFMDLGDKLQNWGVDEPKGVFDANHDGAADRVVVTRGFAVTGIDIVLRDP